MSLSTRFSGVPEKDQVHEGTSVSASLSVPEYADIELGEELWAQTINSLAQKGLRNNRMTRDQFEWLLPKSNATSEAIKIYRKIQQTPMIVSNEELGKILYLEESTMSSPIPSDGGEDIYIRSWALSAEELQGVMDYLVQEGKEFAEFGAWRKVLTLHQSYGKKGNKFTIRFIGSCEVHERPVDCFGADLTNGASDILPEFQTALEFNYPSISSQVHILVDANVSLTCSHTTHDAKRILKELFNPDTLLNRQDWSFKLYVPTREDIHIFNKLGTNYHQRALLTAGPFPALRHNALEKMFNEMQALANRLYGDTGTDNHPWTNGLKQAQLEQATPKTQYKLGTLMVFIGKGISTQDYISQHGFMAGKSRAATLTKHLLDHLFLREYNRLRLEDEENNDDSYTGQCDHRDLFLDYADEENDDEWYTGQFDYRNLYPYYDLWPWPKHAELETAGYFLREYLLIVRPLIVNTYSKLVTNITRADCLHDCGLPPSATFVEHLGELSIQYYANPGCLDDPGESPLPDTAFINIPHLDPLDLTSTEGRLASAAMDVNEELLDTDTKLNRYEICKIVLGRVQEILQSPGGRGFTKSFEEAKADLERHLTVRRISDRAWPEEDSNIEGKELIAKTGFARGQPHSVEREEDLLRLWDEHIPEMHLAVPHNEGQKATWTQQLSSVQPGQSYFLAIASQMPEYSHVRQVLLHLKPWMFSGPDRDLLKNL